MLHRGSISKIVFCSFKTERVKTGEVRPLQTDISSQRLRTNEFRDGRIQVRLVKEELYQTGVTGEEGVFLFYKTLVGVNQ